MDILEYNFTLTHLYSKFESYFTSGKMTCIIYIQYSWSLRGVGHSTTITPLIQTWQGVCQIEL
jgi:hypothetical protein